MRTAIIIPARYASSRLPGKPLLDETGKPLIQHVYERARQSQLADEVIVATDDARIVMAVENFGGKACWTRSDHPSGTDRVAQVAEKLDTDIIVNVQGDEPFIDPASIDRLPKLLEQDSQAQVATLAVPIGTDEQYRSPHCVKVVCDRHGRALYFSRSPIPYVRDRSPQFSRQSPLFLQHLGIYAYRREALLRLAQLPPHPLEEAEKLEQLRILAQGWPIQVGIVAEASISVDTPDDYARFVAAYRQMQAHRVAA
jgi:3-deoxy-manno-octulosonate cytidylyltransferase (CMP-KDO synthetase)